MDRRLNIAMVVRSFTTNGGLELYAHKLAEGLVDRGHTVTVLCEENLSELKHDRLQFVHFERATAKSKGRRLRTQFAAANQALSSMAEFDIVHSQHFPINGADVVTFHNHTVYQSERVGLPIERAINHFKRTFIGAYRLRHQYDEILCKRATCLIFPAMVMKEDFYATYNLGDKPYMVAHPGAGLANDNPSPVDSSSKPTPFTFLFVGKGFRKKGLDVLLNACSILRKKAPPFRLIIAGLRMKPLDAFRLKRLGLDGTVQYLGFQKDMGSVYAQAHAFVLPSRMEPFGMAPLQAMRWGVPAIVSKVSGVSEVLQDGKDGLILQNHTDAQELSELMLKLIQQPRLLSDLSRQAQLVASGVTWDKTVESTLAAYQIALSNRTSPSNTVNASKLK